MIFILNELKLRLEQDLAKFDTFLVKLFFKEIIKFVSLR